MGFSAKKTVWLKVKVKVKVHEKLPGLSDYSILIVKEKIKKQLKNYLVEEFSIAIFYISLRVEWDVFLSKQLLSIIIDMTNIRNDRWLIGKNFKFKWKSKHKQTFRRCVVALYENNDKNCRITVNIKQL